MIYKSYRVYIILRGLLFNSYAVMFFFFAFFLFWWLGLIVNVEVKYMVAQRGHNLSPIPYMETIGSVMYMMQILIKKITPIIF